MIAGVREFLRTRGGQYSAIAGTVLAMGLVVYSIYSNLGGDRAVRLNNERVFVCAETKKPFDFTLAIGTKFPVYSPHSGKETGYPGELCYWTKDGKVKEDPTAVLLNSFSNQPEPTFCPDCERLVTIRNPAPAPGASPPPLKSEMKRR